MSKFSKEYLKDCFMQQCQDEFDAYCKDEESSLDRYSKFSIKNFPYLSLGTSATLVILYLPLNFTFASQLIATFVLVFLTSIILMTRYYMKNKKDAQLKLEIYDAWKKAIFYAIVVNFLLFIVSNNAYNEFLVIVSIAAAALIYIQSGVKRSLLSF